MTLSEPCLGRQCGPGCATSVKRVAYLRCIIASSNAPPSLLLNLPVFTLLTVPQCRSSVPLLGRILLRQAVTGYTVPLRLFVTLTLLWTSSGNLTARTLPTCRQRRGFLHSYLAFFLLLSSPRHCTQLFFITNLWLASRTYLPQTRLSISQMVLCRTMALVVQPLSTGGTRSRGASRLARLPFRRNL